MTKILVVDDDPNISKSLSIRLKGEGYEVINACDGVSAVSAAVKNQPDVILLDITMPAGNGFTVAERLQSITSTMTVPIIYMTASKEPGLHEKAKKSGAVALLEKPYETEELLAVIRAVVPECQA